MSGGRLSSSDASGGGGDRRSPWLSGRSGSGIEVGPNFPAEISAPLDAATKSGASGADGQKRDPSKGRVRRLPAGYATPGVCISLALVLWENAQWPLPREVATEIAQFGSTHSVSRHGEQERDPEGKQIVASIARNRSLTSDTRNSSRGLFFTSPPRRWRPGLTTTPRALASM